MHKLLDNVFHDSASTHRWPDLVERHFLERVIAALKATMGDTFMQYTFFILASREGNVHPQSVRDASPRKILIFISDESSSVPTHLIPHYLAIFKAYLPHEMPGTNIFPFNLGYVRGVQAYPLKSVDDRAIDVFFSGNLNFYRLSLYRALHPKYRRLPRTAFRLAQSLAAHGFERRLLPRDLSHALPRADLHFTDGFLKGAPSAEYGERLADSCIALCPRGWVSTETFRHMEALRAGAVVISEPLPKTHFYLNSPIITVGDWETGIDRVRRLLDDRPALRALQGETIAWWRSICSEEATARYMHSKIKQLSG